MVGLRLPKFLELRKSLLVRTSKGDQAGIMFVTPIV